jgi:hypothetical protein
MRLSPRARAMTLHTGLNQPIQSAWPSGATSYCPSAENWLVLQLLWLPKFLGSLKPALSEPLSLFLTLWSISQQEN